ncbi:MAG: 30S ribosomal protein S1 [Chitinophagaceae bacterium]|nr:30S ribosomal protein S1 [Chitinophagaceae bacterium]
MQDNLKKDSIETEVFDWGKYSHKIFIEEYSDKVRKAMEEDIEKTIHNNMTEKGVIMGNIVSISNKEVLVNVGFKSDGSLPITEFRDIDNLKVGDSVEVYIEEQENEKGQLVLSHKKALIVKAWTDIKEALENQTVIEGLVKRRTKGGLIIDIFGIEAFLPGSQIDTKPIKDYNIYVNKKIEVKILKINLTKDNVIVSHKALMEKYLEESKAIVLNSLERGQIREGEIKNITDFGAFVDLGGVDGLLHITDISWGRVTNPRDFLHDGQKINVVILDFDENKKRISLGMKQLSDHPWESLPDSIIIGSVVTGKIVNVADYGVFMEIVPGVEGLIHVSEMSWSQHMRNPMDFIKIGDLVTAVVLTLDREGKKMSLGIKQLTEDPWKKADLVTKYAVGSVHTGTVKNLTTYGLFIELEEGIDGLAHISDLSWTKKIKHPSEFTNINDKIEVKVIEIYPETRRLGLSHKHLQQNPWEIAESSFIKGSTHKGTVIAKVERGYIVELAFRIEGFCTHKNLIKQDGSHGKVGEELDFIIMDFSKEDKKCSISHSFTHAPATEKTKEYLKEMSDINNADINNIFIEPIQNLSSLDMSKKSEQIKNNSDDNLQTEEKQKKTYKKNKTNSTEHLPVPPSENYKE